MDKVEKDEEREHRITMEAIVDCYGPEERLSGWYCYLDDRLAFPFKARCTKEHLVSPLREGDEVEAIGMADIDDCGNRMFVVVEWMDRSMGIPLSQVAAVNVDPETEQAIGDWHYWKARGRRIY